MPLHLCSLWGHLACSRVNTRRSMCAAFSSLLLHRTSASNTYEFSFQRLSTPISTPVNTTTVVEPQPNPTACALRCMPRRVAQPRAGHVHSHMTRCKPCKRPAYTTYANLCGQMKQPLPRPTLGVLAISLHTRCLSCFAIQCHIRIRPYGHPHEPLARWLVPRVGIPSHNYCTVTVHSLGVQVAQQWHRCVACPAVESEQQQPPSIEHLVKEIYHTHWKHTCSCVTSTSRAISESCWGNNSCTATTAAGHHNATPSLQPA